jgi:cell division protein FtsQ
MNFAGKHRIISRVSIEFRNNKKDSFQLLNNQEIIERIQDGIGNPVGRPASEISLTKLEQHLNTYPEIWKSTSYISFDGVLHVKISERQPIAILQNSQGDMCYIDSAMIMIPVAAYQSKHLLVINGNINQHISIGKKLAPKWQQEFKPILSFFDQHKFWKHLFEQCYVDKFGHLILFPIIGTHSIVMNNVENIDEKFENLRLFYEKGLKYTGWDTYKTIDISYANQIVTKRRVTNTEHQN